MPKDRGKSKWPPGMIHRPSSRWKIPSHSGGREEKGKSPKKAQKCPLWKPVGTKHWSHPENISARSSQQFWSCKSFLAPLNLFSFPCPWDLQVSQLSQKTKEEENWVNKERETSKTLSPVSVFSPAIGSSMAGKERSPNFIFSFLN